MKITHISDTHGYHNSVALSGGDILIHSGDLSDFEKIISLDETIKWISSANYKYKIIVLGNHDEELMGYQFPNDIILLQNSSITINDVRFYGVTATLTESNTKYSFAQSSEEEINSQLKNLDFEILITHGPPKNILDNKLGKSVGSNSLLNFVNEKKPIYHLFGHAHHSKSLFDNGITKFSNASIVDRLSLKTLSGEPFDFTI